MILNATDRKLQVVLAGAITTSQLPVIVDYEDIDTTTYTPGTQATNTNSTTETDILAAPAASHQRKVVALSVFNADTVAATVTIILDIAATNWTVFKATLAVGEKLVWTSALGWAVYDIGGALKQITSGSGVWIGTTVKTSGTTHQVGARTTQMFVRMVGGGGGGGGCTSVAAAAGAAGGGGSGGYAEKTFAVTPGATYTVQVGAAGTGASGAAGNNGTSSIVTVGATVVTAFFGTGGPVMAPAATLKAGAGGAGAAIATFGDLNSGGEPGMYGVCLIVATPILASGNGGSSAFGAGGLGIIAVGNGSAGIGFGAGGGGSATGASTVRTGGNGTAGVLVIDEYA